MKIGTLLALSVLVTGITFAEIKVSVGEIYDIRTPGIRYKMFPKGLLLELQFAGPEVAEALAMRFILEKATDDTGKDLRRPEDIIHSEEQFQKIRRIGKEAADTAEFSQGFLNSTRGAKSIKNLTGIAELLIPSRDPASIITAPVVKDTVKPLAHPALKAAGVEFTIEAVEETSVGYYIKDPKGDVALVEFLDKDGVVLKTKSPSSNDGLDGGKSIHIEFRKTLPADTSVRICLVTAKSVIKVPVQMADITLP